MNVSISSFALSADNGSHQAERIHASLESRRTAKPIAEGDAGNEPALRVASFGVQPERVAGDHRATGRRNDDRRDLGCRSGGLLEREREQREEERHLRSEGAEASSGYGFEDGTHCPRIQ